MNETPTRVYAEIDLDAVRANVRALRERAPGAELMAVVKADAYGHGAIRCARAAQEAGATWLGTATPEEALALRAAGIGGPVMCWLWTPGGPWQAAVEADLDISVSGMWALDEVRKAAHAAGRRARVQLKADTGLGRGGCQPADWAELVGAAVAAQAEGTVKITGLWSHFACADEPGHPSIPLQLASFREMLAYAEKEGVEPEVRHIANSPATLTLPESHYDLVRCGLAVYGVSPAPELGTSQELGLRPAMTLKASVALVKAVPRATGSATGTTTSPRPRRTSPSSPPDTPTASRVTPPAAGRSPSAGRSAASPDASPWTSSSSTWAVTWYGPGTRPSSSAAASTASPPPRTGPERQTPSPMRSSPVSGCVFLGSTWAAEAE